MLKNSEVGVISNNIEDFTHLKLYRNKLINQLEYL